MSKPVLLLDCDGVLADFNQASLDDIRALTGITYTREEIVEFELLNCFPLSKRDKKYIKSLRARPGWCSEIPPFENAKEPVKLLNKLTDLYIVTSPWMSKHWVPERYEWLEKHFNIPHEKVWFGKHKWMVQGDIFVDDKTENCLDYKSNRPNSHVFLWSTAYNKEEKGLIRTNDWEELLYLVGTYGL